jgi:alginate O-acetyltransferase complex protein AlgI
VLFNSYAFICAFLPVTFAGYVLLARLVSDRAAQVWLTLASFYFYGWWNPTHLPLLALSCAGNFLLGRRLAAQANDGGRTRWLLAVGVAANLAVLGYFKYAVFVVDNVTALTGLDFTIRAIVLPTGISFFTFQQIAYLADASKGKAEEYDFVDYCLFVSFFPQLIAGPIVHHREMMGQFVTPVRERLTAEAFALGATYFTVGLFKKVVIADRLAPMADNAFASAVAGAALSAAAAWQGVLAYTLQLYFDFSGYSDMAIGLALLFGIRLPFNFNSPYKATSIVDFWRRWHMTLSRFLRDYLYIPLGGNRGGRSRRYLNLMITMVLGGLWHGAGWTFLIWGALHGLYLMVNHAWLALRRRLGLTRSMGFLGVVAGGGLTFLCVMVAWVFFRAPSLEAATRMLAAMAGQHGFLHQGDALAPFFGVMPEPHTAAAQPGGLARALLPWLLLGAVWLMPNTQEIIEGLGPQARRFALRWQPTPAWACAISFTLLFSMTQMSKVSAFLYFQF